MGGCVGVCVGNALLAPFKIFQTRFEFCLFALFLEAARSQSDCIDIMKNCTLLIALAWLARFLLVQANSPPPRRIRTTVVKKGSTIPLPSNPFGDAKFRNSYRMHSRKYHNKGKNHERQLQNKKTRKRNEKARKGTSQRLDWKRGRGRA